MIHTILTYLARWNESTDQRRQLQHVYAFGGVALIVVAGLVGLYNYGLGQLLLTAALFSIAIFFVNAFVWEFLSSIILRRLKHYDTRRRPRSRKR